MPGLMSTCSKCGTQFHWNSDSQEPPLCPKCGYDTIFNGKRTPNFKSSEGCFIATACYGTPDCREVLQLRRFRDEVLSESRLGRVFISQYYFLSPPFARLLQKIRILRTVVKYSIVKPVGFIASRFPKQ